MPADLTPGYRHIAKRATPGAPVTTPAAALKFYTLAPADQPVAAPVIAAARTRVATHSATLRPDDRGFVILHRCGADFHFLLTSVWRGANELWEAVDYNAPAGFAPFDPAYPPAGGIRPTFCVWELGIVAHEALAWSHFLRSPRTANDLEIWQQSLFTGEV